MALSRDQIILLKRAQREAMIDDGEYRQQLASLTKLPGCTSSKDPRLTDEHLDLFLKFFEAIFWRAVDAGVLPPPWQPKAVFRVRGFWAAKNPKGQTSRDRYTSEQIAGEIAGLERSLKSLGFGPGYCAAIRHKATGGAWQYRAALERTLKAKLASAPSASANEPF